MAWWAWVVLGWFTASFAFGPCMGRLMKRRRLELEVHDEWAERVVAAGKAKEP